MSIESTSCKYPRTRRWVARPSEAKRFRVLSDTRTSDCVKSGSCEKPLAEVAKAWRSRTYSPIATAGRGVVFEGVEIMPKGMLFMEK